MPYIPVEPARIFCCSNGDEAGTWWLYWFLRSHSCSVSCFMLGSFFFVLRSYVNGTAFMWFWTYVTSPLQSQRNSQFSFFSLYCCRSLLARVSSSEQAPFCQKKPERQLSYSPAILQSLLQPTGLIAVIQSSAQIPLLPLCFLRWCWQSLWGMTVRRLDGSKYYWWAAEGLATVFVESWGNWPCTLY